MLIVFQILTVYFTLAACSNKNVNSHDCCCLKKKNRNPAIYEFMEEYMEDLAEDTDRAVISLESLKYSHPLPTTKFKKIKTTERYKVISNITCRKCKNHVRNVNCSNNYIYNFNNEDICKECFETKKCKRKKCIECGEKKSIQKNTNFCLNCQYYDDDQEICVNLEKAIDILIDKKEISTLYIEETKSQFMKKLNILIAGFIRENNFDPIHLTQGLINKFCGFIFLKKPEGRSITENLRYRSSSGVFFYPKLYYCKLDNDKVKEFINLIKSPSMIHKTDLNILENRYATHVGDAGFFNNQKICFSCNDWETSIFFNTQNTFYYTDEYIKRPMRKENNIDCIFYYTSYCGKDALIMLCFTNLEL